MRTVLGVLAGIVVAIICIFVIEGIGHFVYPPPPDLDLSNPEAAARIIAALPLGAFVFVLAGWFLGTLAGGWTANAIGRVGVGGWVVALVVICGGLYTMWLIPHPTWMWAAGVGLPLVAAWLVQRFAAGDSKATMS
jgi:hypothetical protein